jgi:hypothetical protein
MIELSVAALADIPAPEVKIKVHLLLKFWIKEDKTGIFGSCM